MKKNELVAAMAEKSGLNKTQAAAALDAFVDSVKGQMKKGGDVNLIGFGKFYVTRSAARTGRNPRTNQPIKIAAANQPKFKAGKGLKDFLN